MFTSSTVLKRLGCAVALGVAAQAVFAQQVVLKDIKGNMNISGELISIANGEFIVRTSVGEISVPQNSVTCEGTACPKPISELEKDVELLAPIALANNLLPILVEGYATLQEAEAIQLGEDGMMMEDGEVDVDDHSGMHMEDEAMSSAIQVTSFDGDTLGTFGIKTAAGDEAFAQMSKSRASIVFSEEQVDRANIQLVRRSGGGNITGFQQERVIAVDGFAAITHPTNTIQSMTISQISDIFVGKITNWSQLGGSDMPINLYSFNEKSETFHHIKELILEPFGHKLGAQANMMKSSKDITKAVKNDPNGFGVVSYSNVRSSRVVPVAGECGIVTAPTAFSLKTEEYALQNRILAYSRSDANASAKQFINFLDSASMDGLVAKAGFINQDVVIEEGNANINRMRSALLAPLDEPLSAAMMRNMIVDMLDTKRISTTFRFAPGSSDLDNKARRDLQRVIDYIAEIKPEKVILVGFADSFGKADVNQALSLKRAQSVLNQLRAASNGALGGVSITAQGYGEVGPVACNETFEGRATNRRVEVWVQ